ncbi:MAG: hypothetical protein F4Y47_10000 [Acidobacteriia bacterium]|nr:hypothetical protein [Terriglobia bacterium]MYG00747.1 hypothetical protein [Terriglobia bacterium]MYK11782.1 hypothetical protein [Terriglobia bacterium]
MTRRWIALLALVAPAAAQRRDGSFRRSPGRIPETLPDGRSRALITLKNDADKSRTDMARVVELATELQREIEKNEFHTVDLGSVRKAEEILKLVRRVKARLSRQQ